MGDYTENPFETPLEEIQYGSLPRIWVHKLNERVSEFLKVAKGDPDNEKKNDAFAVDYAAAHGAQMRLQLAA